MYYLISIVVCSLILMTTILHNVYNYTITVCNYTYGLDEATCNGCDLINVSLQDMLCQNEGSCILLSAPDNYLCNCSGIIYMWILIVLVS